MFGPCEVVAIKPSHEGQGKFVHINKSDFDPANGHELYVDDETGGDESDATASGAPAAADADSAPKRRGRAPAAADADPKG